MTSSDDPIVCEAWDRRAAGAINALGVKTWGELSSLSPANLLKIKGLGRGTLNYIQERMRERGVIFTATRCLDNGLTVASVSVQGVYFVECDGFIKIGFAKNIRDRFGSIAQMNPHRCDLVAVIRTNGESESRQLERELHTRFAEHRHRLEWFHYAPEIQAYVATLNRRVQ